MKNIVGFALEIATEAHKGQKRRNGDDYITHPIAVANILMEKFKIPKTNLSVALAYCHDVCEDCGITENELVEKIFGKKPTCESCMFGGWLYTLNKNHFKSYKEYILYNRREGSASTINVKICDLLHNLSDAKPGSLKDKYELALHILEN